MQHPVFYRSTVRGWDQRPGQPPSHFYVGFVRRITTNGGTRSVDDELAASAMEITAYLGPRRLADGTLAELVPGVDIERYEIFDVDNDDILVFWRVPMRQAKQDAGEGT